MNASVRASVGQVAVDFDQNRDVGYWPIRDDPRASILRLLLEGQRTRAERKAVRRPHKIGIGRVLGALLDGLELVITEVRPALRLHDFALNRVGNLARVPSMPQCLDVGTGHNLCRFQKFLELRIGRSNNSHLLRHVITPSQSGVALFQSSAYNFLISASVRPALRARSLPMFLTRASASRSMPAKISSCSAASCGLPSLSL